MIAHNDVNAMVVKFSQKSASKFSPNETWETAISRILSGETVEVKEEHWKLYSDCNSLLATAKRTSLTQHIFSGPSQWALVGGLGEPTVLLWKKGERRLARRLSFDERSELINKDEDLLAMWKGKRAGVRLI